MAANLTALFRHHVPSIRGMPDGSVARACAAVMPQLCSDKVMRGLSTPPHAA